MTDFLVRRDDLRSYRIDDGETAATGVPPGSVQFRVERFGLTANNLTYGLAGDSLGYWQFFPAPPGWGRLPVWGFGQVNASGVDGIRPGDRFYGYWPMSTYVTMDAVPDEAGFVASSAARASLPPIYNQYLRATPEAGFAPAHDDAAALARPLFLTGRLIAEQLTGEGRRGADAVVLTSASSKTAFSTAWSLGQYSDRPRVIGLTAAGNVGFVEGLGVYDQVLDYDDLAALPVYRGVVLVDIAGSADLRRAVHETARAALTDSITVGATHWEKASFEDEQLPGPQPVRFFAPAVLEERLAAMGAQTFFTRANAAWSKFADWLSDHIEIERATGAHALATTYAALADGAVGPKGLVCTL